MKINGPTNVVRLQGKVGNINKVIYVFFDFHINEYDQTKCDDIRSDDVARFFVRTFDNLKNNNLTYDFMFERQPLRPSFIPSQFKGRYFDQVLDVFNKSFDIEIDKNIVKKSKELPNVRLHWADIRDYTFNRTLDLVYNNIPRATDAIWNLLNINNVLQLSDLVKMINAQVVFLYGLIYDTKDFKIKSINKPHFSQEETILASYSLEDYDELSKKVLFKILTKYENKDVGKQVLNIITTELNKHFNDFFNFVNDALKRLETYAKDAQSYGKNVPADILFKHGNEYGYGLPKNDKDKLRSFLADIEHNMHKYIIGVIGSNFMDLFLLRRFLDKKYMTNALTYTGAAHSINIIRYLVKYFNFDITHCAYSKHNINETMKIIHKSKSYDELSELFYAPVLKQCTDMSKFPKLFD